VHVVAGVMRKDGPEIGSVLPCFTVLGRRRHSRTGRSGDMYSAVRERRGALRGERPTIGNRNHRRNSFGRVAAVLIVTAFVGAGCGAGQPKSKAQMVWAFDHSAVVEGAEMRVSFYWGDSRMCEAQRSLLQQYTRRFSGLSDCYAAFLEYGGEGAAAEFGEPGFTFGMVVSGKKTERPCAFTEPVLESRASRCFPATLRALSR
jgi:hypothetical protein